MGAAYGLKRKIDRAKKTESIIKIEHRNVRISETEHTKREKGHLRNTYCNFTKSDIYAWTTPSNGIIFVAMNTNESFQTIIVSDLLSEKFTLKCSPVWSYDTSLTHKTLSLSPPPSLFNCRDGLSNVRRGFPVQNSDGKNATRQHISRVTSELW